MALLMTKFKWTEGTSLRGVWSSKLDLSETEESPLLGCAYYLRLSGDSDPFMEATNFEAFLPLCAGGVHGAFPDGSYWMVLFQIEPADSPYELFGITEESDLLARQLQRVPFLKAIGTVDDRWYFDTDELRSELSTYVSLKQAKSMKDWSMFELLKALQTQLCSVTLEQVVTGRITQCAYPDLDHDCQHDVFSDVFAQWGQPMQGGQP